MWRTKVLPVLMLTLHLLEARPQQDSLVTSMPANTATTVSTTGSMAKPQVYSLNLRTDIRSRYARTLVTSRIANPADRAQEVTFQVTIPESAFVSKFIMEVDGTMMEGVVRERVQAKQEYHQAVQSGQTAGHVATASVRDSSHVRISVNVAPHSKASFNLTYEELLIRRKGRYELAINLNPGQLVREMAVDVYIQEATNITNLQVPAFRSTNEIDINESETVNDDAVVEWVSGRQAHVHFAPTLEAQRRLGASAGSEEKGLGGQFIVRYDVERENGAGEILALDGYFVHFFSPPELSPLPKHVIFVLDVSGSMHGRKIEQLREAMDVILRELRPVDYFNIIEFSYSVTVVDLESLSNSIVLSPETSPYGYPGMEEKDEPKAVAELPAQVKAFPANEEFITKARDAVRKMSAGGGTNINDAVRAALSVAKKAVDYNATDAKLPEPIIIFLTDGEATVGETRPDRILTQIEELNTVPIFSLAFGQDADLSFLKRLSLRAGAFARKIYEAADAALQLQDFYRQVASPLLANVKFTYLDSQVDGSSLTKQQFGLLFSGSELVVAGKLRDANTQDLQLGGEVRGQGHDGITAFPLHTPIDDESVVLPLPGRPQMSATPSPQPGDRFLERLWAYLTIQQLLERYDAERQDDQRVVENGTTPSPAQNAKSKALELALKFSFVTPVTSLIVVKTLNGSQTTPSPSTASSTTQTPLALQFAESQPLSGDRIAGGAAYGGGAFFAQAAYPASAAGFAGSPGFASRPSYPVPISAPAQPQAQEAVSKIDSQDEAKYTPRPVLSTTYRPQATRPPATHSPVSFNLTRMNEEALTWLQTELNETSTPEWRTVRISNEAETYKLLYSNQSTITGDLAACTPPTLPPTDWKCRPLSDCVLAAFVDNADLFLSSFKCTVGTEGFRFLGTCCPELPEKQSEPQTAITEASEVTTQSSTDTSPQAA